MPPSANPTSTVDASEELKSQAPAMNSKEEEIDKGERQPGVQLHSEPGTVFDSTTIQPIPTVKDRVSLSTPTERLSQIQRRKRTTRDDMFQEIRQASAASENETRAWRITVADSMEKDRMKRRKLLEKEQKVQQKVLGFRVTAVGSAFSIVTLTRHVRQREINLANEERSTCRQSAADDPDVPEPGIETLIPDSQGLSTLPARSAGSDRSSGGQLDVINQLLSALPSTPELHQNEAYKRSRWESVSCRLTSVKTPRRGRFIESSRCDKLTTECSPIDSGTPLEQEVQAELTGERQQSTYRSEDTVVNRSKYTDFGYVIHVAEVV
ncbi:hypothetical protein UY3_05733 [Chelonia mydas]|uniref:Uncharacterized protein n=1 Tax=Chelonia mydas TaxID=8469 RepID=M7C9A8_CHEMY|nr:hypothetical protein UY3_05733 [Chelonia mydas]